MISENFIENRIEMNNIVQVLNRDDHSIGEELLKISCEPLRKHFISRKLASGNSDQDLQRPERQFIDSAHKCLSKLQ